MIQVEVCSNCKTKIYDLGQGIDIYEEFKQYEELFLGFIVYKFVI